MTTLDYPAWLRIEHWVNVLFLTLVIRSGIEILSSYPKLFWRDDSVPGGEWARFTRKTMPTDKLYDTWTKRRATRRSSHCLGTRNSGWADIGTSSV